MLLEHGQVGAGVHDLILPNKTSICPIRIAVSIGDSRSSGRGSTPLWDTRRAQPEMGNSKVFEIH